MVKDVILGRYLKSFQKRKWPDILLFQLFGPVLFSAHVYGRSQLAGTNLAVWAIFWKFAQVKTAPLKSTVAKDLVYFLWSVINY